ncbi:hypothetical protein D9M68_412210 [compost metagenome]|uniref:hypothetical protein n=1 Tax=Cupriavidus necator TaxID=106590 RepID=UPI0028B83E3C
MGPLRDGPARTPRGGFAQHGNIYATSEDEQQTPPTYIHLRGAKFFGPGGEAIAINNGAGMLWRGRIAEVSGFLLGTFSKGA